MIEPQKKNKEKNNLRRSKKWKKELFEPRKKSSKFDKNLGQIIAQASRVRKKNVPGRLKL